MGRSGVGASHKSLLLSTTMLISALAGYGRRAYGACAPNPSPRFECSGDASVNTSTQTINADDAEVVTLPFFGVDASAGTAIAITGNGALSFTDDNSSPLTAAGTALRIYATGDSAMAPGSMTINTTGALTGGAYGIYAFNAGSGIVDITTNGDVVGSSSSGGGILAINYGGTDLKITTGAGTKVSGRAGILVDNYSSIAGAVTISAHGDVYGTGTTGISARNYGTSLIVTTDTGTHVEGYIDGITASNYGSGALEIKAFGDVSGTIGVGINALSLGGTGVYVATGANTTVSGGDHGILAFNIDGADVTVTTGENSVVTGSTSGIFADNYGGGKTVVETFGDVTGTASYGIQARHYSGTGGLTITTGGGTKTYGGTAGIYANAYASAALTITANGDVIGNTHGIISIFRSSTSDVTITTAAGTKVEGGNNGIRATGDGSGLTTLNVNGDVAGGTDGIFVSGNNSAITINLAATGSVTSTGTGADDFGIDISRGAAAVIVAGTVTGGGGGGAVQFDSNATKSGWFELHSTAVITGAVLAGSGSNDSFVLGGTGSGTFDVGNVGADQQYRGFEVFIKNGAGTWTLTGVNTSVPTWVVNEGRLNVNADMPNTAFSVSSSTLGGTGTIGSLAAGRDSTIAPGNTIGTLTVMGNAILGSGSIFEVEVNAQGDSDLLVVNGTVELTGAILNVIADAGNYAAATSYLIVDNDGVDPVIGAFGAVNTNLAFLTPSVSYTANTGNDVELTLTRNTTSFSDAAQTSNQRAVAGALDTLPAGDPLVLALVAQTNAGARQAFDALSGEIHSTVGGMLTDESHFLRDAIFSRLLQAYYGGGSVNSVAALAGAGPEVAALGSAPMMGLGMGQGGTVAPPFSTGLVAWTQAFGSWGDFKSDGNAASADRTLGGFISGLDAGLGGGWRAGLAAGFTQSTTSVEARANSADINSYHVAAYAGGALGPLALRSGAAWTWHDIETERAIVFPGFFQRADASYDGDTGQVFGELAMPLSGGGTALEAFGRVAYVHVSTGGFTENGGIAALGGGQTTETMTYSMLGGRAATAMRIDGMHITPHASAAWHHAFDDVTTDMVLAFSGSGASFVIAGVPIARDSAFIEAGLDLKIAPDATLGVSYNGQLASDVQDHGISGRLNWRF